jgi:DNA-binding transcriptional ArsR family regulator
MAVAAPVLDDVACIGETAGVVWQVLSKNGPMTIAKLVKAVREPRDTVMQALGWLGREDKICIEEEGRGRVVSLRQCGA